MKQSFQTTTGIKSKAGELLWEQLKQPELGRFMALLDKFRKELKGASGLASQLLYDHFRNRVRGSNMDTFKLNVLNIVWNLESPLGNSSKIPKS